MHYKGLTSHEVQKRLEKFGKNEITSSDKSGALKVLVKQLSSPLIYILLAAAAVSAIVGEATDSIFILAVVIVNSALGFFQEYRAENALSALKERVSRIAKVIRDGHKQSIAVTELVPGDIVILESGLTIPADGFVLESTELHVNESILTGESLPILKKAGDKIFKGTSVVQGFGHAEIEKTGDNTEFGKIAKSISSDFDPVTPTKRRLQSIGKILTISILILVVVIFLLGLSSGIEVKEILFIAVALGVSTIPEGLIIVYTVTLALGMNRLLQKKSIVKNLQAAETLGNVDILCIDKTGTITRGEMEVSAIDFTDDEIAFKALAICNNDNNFIDKAVAKFIDTSKGNDYIEKMVDKRVQFFPFSSDYKYTGAFDGKTLYAVGAPEILLRFASEKDREKWHKVVNEQAKIGNRVIAVAHKNISISQVAKKDFKDMKFLGLVFISDPVRESVITSLEKVISAGIGIKIITGDMKETTLTVLKKIGLNLKEEEIISGFDLNQAKGKPVFDKMILKTSLFYRTTPEQKLSIVESLQKQNKKVAMMGDGVNDSPALRRAEIGIAVDSATDVSKESADLILLDSNFQTLVDAVEEGRNIFANLRKIFVYLFAGSLTETVLILSALLFKLPLPFTALQLLWINIIEDGLPSLALSFDKSKTNLLTKEGNTKDKSIFDKSVITSIAIIGLITDIFYFALFKYLLDIGYRLEHAQSIIFAGVALSSLAFLFSAKTVDSNIWKENIFNNKVLNFSLILGVFLLSLTLYWPPLQTVLNTVPLNLQEIQLITFLAIMVTFLVEIVKLIMRKIRR